MHMLNLIDPLKGTLFAAFVVSIVIIAVLVEREQCVSRLTAEQFCKQSKLGFTYLNNVQTTNSKLHLHREDAMSAY